MGLFSEKRQALNLALQGGGAHGALTWGVLDRLLEEPVIEFGAISSTSAGAINAVALASGFASDGAMGARAKLLEVWTAVGNSAPPDLMSLNPFQMGRDMLGEMAGASAEQMAQVFSPSQLNPMNLDPLREIIERYIDFDVIKKPGGIKLFVAATEVATGRARIFDTQEISIDVVLASACLPNVQRAVEIDEVFYWDGGFSANPDLSSLVLKSRVEDSLLVQLEPLRVDELPTSARSITNHVNWLTFNQPLRRELEMIHSLRQARVGYFVGSNSRLLRYKGHRFHHIDGGEFLGKLSTDSKVRPDAKNLKALFDEGRVLADRWVNDHLNAVGKKSSVKLGDLIK